LHTKATSYRPAYFDWDAERFNTEQTSRELKDKKPWEKRKSCTFPTFTYPKRTISTGASFRRWRLAGSALVDIPEKRREENTIIVPERKPHFSEPGPFRRGE